LQSLSPWYSKISPNRTDYEDSYAFEGLLLTTVKRRQGSSTRGIYNTMTLALLFPNRDDIATPKIWPIAGRGREG
jgi:hypothetical protein